MATNENMGKPVRQGIQPQACSFCGSVWFRSATFLPSCSQPNLPAPIFAVCICGMPVAPRLSGIQPNAIQPELDRLIKVLALGISLRRMLSDAEFIPEIAIASGLIKKISRLERACQLLGRRILNSPCLAKLSRPPIRVAATQGIDRIALELQRTGLLDFRKARFVVGVVRELWKAAIIRGESVETPIGILSIKTTPSGRRWTSLENALELDFAVEVTPPREVPTMPPNPSNTSTAQCSRCGSEWFAEHEFRKYANDFYSHSVGGAMVTTSDSQIVRICLCGMLFRPKRNSKGRPMPTADQISFLESWKRAENHLQRQSEAEERIKVELRAVNPEYIQQLSARVESAEGSIAQFTAELKGRHLRPRRKTT